jgi:hypothetical protein
MVRETNPGQADFRQFLDTTGPTIARRPRRLELSWNGLERLSVR